MKLIQIFIIVCITAQYSYTMQRKSQKTISKAVQTEKKVNELIAKLQHLFSLYQQENPSMTPAQQALYHFQNTQPSSGPYVPIIPIKKYDVSSAGYHSVYCSIILYQNWADMPPAMQYATLLHEYRHRMQHIAGIFDQEDQNEIANRLFYPRAVVNKARVKHVSFNFNHYTELTWKPYEYDADYFAATHITCPTCLKICQCPTLLKDNSALGYFNNNDIQPFIDQASNNPTCPAHTLISGDFEHNNIVKTLNKKLNNYKLIPSDLLYDEIIRLDKESGTLLQHIPTFAMDLITNMKEYDDFEQLLAEKTVKELDIAEQIKQTEKDIAEGKFKLLTAGNEPIVSENFAY